MSASTITLIGDGIENPGNARAMQAAAAMFGGGCAFRDRAGLSHGRLGQPCGAPLPTLTTAAIATGHAPLIALENAPGAAPVFGWRLPPGPAPALVAGNERRGIARDLRTAAGHTVAIPLASRSLNTLNVAAASAVALYALTRQPGSQRTSAHPATRRPEVLLLGAARHVELGSAIRSAGAFGWSRVLVEDRARVWFGVERGVRAEGRAAARRARNPIRLLPVANGAPLDFDEVVVVSRMGGPPLHRCNLARGPRQLVVLPDEDVVTEEEPWERLGRRVTRASLALPCPEAATHYRLPASVALAEVARQVGRPAAPPPGRRSAPAFDRALELLPEAGGEIVYLEDLTAY